MHTKKPNCNFNSETDIGIMTYATLSIIDTINGNDQFDAKIPCIVVLAPIQREEDLFDCYGILWYM